VIDDQRLPYPGLRAFEREESHLFFGRERDVDELIARLASARFLAVVGASGSGKSSLVRTGLLSALDLGYFARAGARWRVAEMRPGGQPLTNLAAALDEASAAETKPSMALLRRFLAQGPRSVVEWSDAGNLEPDENLLILVDQFEELFRYGDYAAREEAEAFVALLLESARAEDARIHVVLTMRSEYLGACALIPGLAEEINHGLYLTPRLSREGCREAIEGPARVCGFRLEPALTNQILNDLASFAPWEQDQIGAQGQLLSRRADQLPLMQHLLNRLWLNAEPGADGVKLLTQAAYDQLGGLEGALEAHGDEVLQTLGDIDPAKVERLFRALVSGPDPTSAIRRPCRLAELSANIGGDDAAARAIVEAFRAADCNFLRPEADEPLTDDTIVDISHESLIRQWSVLAAWLRAEARADSHWRRLLLAQERHAQGEGDLMAGLELDAVAAWWDQEQPTAVWADRHGGGYEAVGDFLRISREAKAEVEREKLASAVRGRRRLLTTLMVVSALLVVAVGSNIYAGILRGQATDLRAEREILRNEIDKLEETRLELGDEIMQFRKEQAQYRAEIENNKAILENRERDLNIVQGKITEAEKNLEAAKTRTARISSVKGIPKNLQETIIYCEDHRDEQACKLLNGR
jgi:hypothetical protein